MQPRMKNPATIIPDAMKAIQALNAATEQGGVPAATLALMHLRASQINGCSFCCESGSCHAKASGETDERLFAVAAWREAPYFTDASAARHYDERGLAALLLMIATTNVFNRLNVPTRQVAGSWG